MDDGLAHEPCRCSSTRRRASRGLAGVFIALLAVSSAVSAQYQDNGYGGYEDKPRRQAPYEPSNDGRGGGNWQVPAAVAGVVALTMVGRWLGQRSQAANEPGADDSGMTERLIRQGPELSSQFNSSAFAAVGMVRSNWPFIVDFAHDEPIVLTLRISAQGVADIYTLRVPFGADETGKHRLQFQLPPAFNDWEHAAAIAVTATDMSGERTAPSFRIYALGCGPLAIGSVAIEEVSFLPRRIRPQVGEQAQFRFFSHSSFPRAVAEFMRVEPAADGEQYFFVDEAPIVGGVSAGRSIDPRQWDGRDASEQPSTGTHRLQVRAWAPTGGWITAWSDTRVRVSP